MIGWVYSIAFHVHYRTPDNDIVSSLGIAEADEHKDERIQLVEPPRLLLAVHHLLLLQTKVNYISNDQVDDMSEVDVEADEVLDPLVVSVGSFDLGQAGIALLLVVAPLLQSDDELDNVDEGVNLVPLVDILDALLVVQSL